MLKIKFFIKIKITALFLHSVHIVVLVHKEQLVMKVSHVWHKLFKMLPTNK